MEETAVTCLRCGAKNRLKPASGDQVPVCGKCRNPLPWIVNSTDIGFRRELEAPIPVLVDFWAEWCAPCRLMTPVLEDLAGENAGRIKIVKVNVDHNPATAEQFNIHSIPTMILFKNGQPVQTFVGAMSKQALLERLTDYWA